MGGLAPAENPKSALLEGGIGIGIGVGCGEGWGLRGSAIAFDPDSDPDSDPEQLGAGQNYSIRLTAVQISRRITNVAFISLNLGMPNSLNGIQVDSSHAVTLWQIHFNCLPVGSASRPDMRAEARTHMRYGLSSSHVGMPFTASRSQRDIIDPNFPIFLMMLSC